MPKSVKKTQKQNTSFLRGQSAVIRPVPVCRGTLTIILEGPQGCGKSLVAKVLRALLPLLPLAEVNIEEKRLL